MASPRKSDLVLHKQEWVRVRAPHMLVVKKCVLVDIISPGATTDGPEGQ